MTWKSKEYPVPLSYVDLFFNIKVNLNNYIIVDI